MPLPTACRQDPELGLQRSVERHSGRSMRHSAGPARNGSRELAGTTGEKPLSAPAMGRAGFGANPSQTDPGDGGDAESEDQRLAQTRPEHGAMDASRQREG